jgi:excisionase family DNA binding protein
MAHAIQATVCIEGERMETESLLSVEQAASKLGISPLTMRAWLRQRRVSFVRLGRRVLVDTQDINKFIRDHRIEAVSFDDEG